MAGKDREGVILTRAAYDKLQDVVRRADAATRKMAFGESRHHSGPVTDVTVRVAGCPPEGSRVYRGRFVFENTTSDADNEDKWLDLGRCEVLGMNEEVLKYGYRYTGRIVAVVDDTGLPRVRVSALAKQPDPQYTPPADGSGDGECSDGASSEFDLVVPGQGNLPARQTWNGLSGDWALKKRGVDEWRYASSGPWILTHESGNWVLTGYGNPDTNVVVFKCPDGGFDCETGGSFTFDSRTGPGNPWDSSISTLVLSGTNAPPFGDCLEDTIGENTSADCSRLASLESTACLLLVVVGNPTGRCLAVDENQIVLLSPNTYTAVWESNTQFVTDTGSYDVVYDWPAGDCCPRLKIGDTYLRFLGCVNGKHRFVGYGDDLCGGIPSSEPCNPNSFIVDLSCAMCPNPDYDGPGWYCVASASCDPGHSKACVHYDSDPGVGPLLCSGPHATVEDCTGVCETPTTVDVCEGVTLPNPLYFKFVDSDGTCLRPELIGVEIPVYWDSDYGGFLGCYDLPILEPDPFDPTQNQYLCDEFAPWGGEMLHYPQICVRVAVSCTDGAITTVSVGWTGGMMGGISPATIDSPSPLHVSGVGSNINFYSSCCGHGVGEFAFIVTE